MVSFGMDKDEMRERAQELLDAFALGKEIDANPSIEATDELMPLLRAVKAGYFFENVEFMRVMWGAEPLVLNAVVRSLGKQIGKPIKVYPPVS